MNIGNSENIWDYNYRFSRETIVRKFDKSNLHIIQSPLKSDYAYLIDISSVPNGHFFDLKLVLNNTIKKLNTSFENQYIPRFSRNLRYVTRKPCRWRNRTRGLKSLSLGVTQTPENPYRP